MNKNCNLNDLFKNKFEWEKEYLKLKLLLENISRIMNKEKYNNDDIYEQLVFIEKELIKVFTYSKLVYNINLNDKNNLEEYNKALCLVELYNNILTDLFNKNSIVENYEINMEKAYNSFLKLNLNNKFKLKGITINVSTYIKELNDNKNNKNIIEKKFNKYYEDNSDLFFKFLFNYVENKISFSKAYNFSNPYLEFLNKNVIPSNKINNFIRNIHNNIDFLSNLINIKTKSKNKQINFYDLDLLKYDSNITFSYDESIRIILSSLKKLGYKYVSIAKKAFYEGWIDCSFSNDKINIPMCINCPDIHPYIIINYKGTLKDIFNLTHELGHAVNCCLLPNRNQNSILSEISSNVHEFLLYEYLYKNNLFDKCCLEEFLLEKIRLDLFRQLISFELERYIYTLKNIDKNKIMAYYMKLIRKYYGNKIIYPNSVKYSLFSNPNLYNSFNSIKYPIGIIGGYYFFSKLNNENNIKEYMSFLKEAILDYKDFYNKFKINFMNEEIIKNFFVEIFKYINEVNVN